MGGFTNYGSIRIKGGSHADSGLGIAPTTSSAATASPRRENEKTGRVGANPTLEAVRTAFLPEELFPITDFLVLSTRERTFAALYHRIGIILTRTEVLRRYYDRSTQTFNRRACQQNHSQLIAQLTDVEELLAQTNYFIALCNSLRQIINAN